MIEAEQDPRLVALEALEMMGSAPEERFDRITRMAEELFRVPVAEIHFLDDTTLFTKSPQRPDAVLAYPRAGTFCDATLEKRTTFVVPDLGADEAWVGHEHVAGYPHVRFYAGRPLSVEGDLQLGTLCLIDFVPRSLTPDERQLLEEFGEWVERELRDTAERDRAADMQTQMAPSSLHHPAGYELSGLSLPRWTITGDFYSWRGDDETVDLTLVDVMGKGTAAAIVAASIRSAFRARLGGDPDAVVSAVSAQLHDDFTATETFATLFHGRLDTASGRIDFVDAGHGLTVLLRADGSFQRLAALGLPLGIAEDGGWITQTVELAVGDSLLAFTDGVLDLYDGTLQSLARAVDLARDSADTAEFLQALKALAASGSASDDITALVLTRTGADRSAEKDPA
ncbi:PP2C family protein-serine/threonine phosphatase [Rathayibacter sp. AY1E2]|uniref:PP2C family protein-serine/threonine phosphatase n=1 Tax=Rathayibacter sp. AY1E2 TaxID=2080550 RepID=UPI000CE7AB36|nr:GAF domain-containing SpoIIE family protein phosphatase [Rathayibacter sp. AY1E2]PPH51696.1 protein phosphatase [Rathayibacter sp. AY1E2]